MTDASHRPTTARGAVGPPTATAVTLLAASTLTVMAPTIVAPALPSIAREFAGVAQADLLVPLVLTLPALVIAVTASGAGALVDRIGRRPVLLGGILLYGLAGGTGVFVGSLPGCWPVASASAWPSPPS
jgi:MFS family permease